MDDGLIETTDADDIQTNDAVLAIEMQRYEVLLRLFHQKLKRI